MFLRYGERKYSMDKLYELIVNERHRDCQRLWFIFSVLSAINSGLLAALSFSSSNVQGFRLIISLLGVFICIIWLLLIDKMINWSNWWEKKLEEIEPYYFEWIKNNRNPQPILPQDFKLFVDRQGVVPGWIPGRRLAQILPFLFLMVWIYITVKTMCQC